MDAGVQVLYLLSQSLVVYIWSPSLDRYFLKNGTLSQSLNIATISILILSLIYMATLDLHSRYPSCWHNVWPWMCELHSCKFVLQHWLGQLFNVQRSTHLNMIPSHSPQHKHRNQCPSPWETMHPFHLPLRTHTQLSRQASPSTDNQSSCVVINTNKLCLCVALQCHIGIINS